MISPFDNQKFAIPIAASKVNRDSAGNFVPKVQRDLYDRITKAEGIIEAKDEMPSGSTISEMLENIFQRHCGTKVNVQQIIPKCWGGSGGHPDNYILPSAKQIKTKIKGPSELELQIADYLKQKGTKIIFCYEFKYENDSDFPVNSRRYIDVIQTDGCRRFFRNGLEYKLPPI
uniref:Uncharacterized protein n=1 Tax=Panagrolaimus superbus TaxID=310955 RepID=A0A914YX05_9BILA